MSDTWPFTSSKIRTRLALIEPMVHRRRADVAPFRLLPLSAAIVDAPICSDPSGWEEIPHQSYWGRADLNFVLKSTFEVPQGWDAAHLALHLPLGVLGDIFNHPEALVHVDGQPIGSADRYHHTLPLDPALADGRAHVLSLHGWTGHAGWPPDPSSTAQLMMGRPAVVERAPELLAFVRLARAALDTVGVLPQDRAERTAILAALNAAFRVLDTRDPLGAALHASVAAAQAVLAAGLAEAGPPLDVTLHAIGHAHMDIAYLWPIDQIRLKNARTYSNVLRLMDSNPAFHFSHSQPQLYEMTAHDYPALFAQIKDRVAEGRWEVMGGMWVEPDLNIPGPEALVRQLTLGRKYYRETFGEVETPVLWLPDTFGFPGQIPQLMRQAGLPWFATNKLNWNQYNKVSASTHHWEGIDGSRVLAHVLTTPREVQYLPFPTNYKSDLSAAEVLGTWTNATPNATSRDLPICFGYGDGGGGPTEDLLAKAAAYAAMPGMPRVRLSTVRAAFEQLEQATDLPVWRGEHYLEGHRGVFTSQGWIKRANRKAEWALHEAEALSAMAGLAPDLTEAWKLLCLNQFHDIVTGTSVGQVFEDARAGYARISSLAEQAAVTAAQSLVGPAPMVLNTSPVRGPRLVCVDPELNPAGAGQATAEGCLLYFNDLAPYCGVALSDATSPPGQVTATATSIGATLENALIRVDIAANGQITRVLDKGTGQESLAPGSTGNQLQAFEDRPICWDAWDIDPDFEDRMEVIDTPTAIKVIETGPLRAAIQVKRMWRSSTITQIVRLCAHSRRIDFVTTLDWHEQHILLKAAFPSTIDAPQATFDIQWGTIDRATTRNTPFDAARFEVPAQKWARLWDGTRGLALLNDCKYGYDVRAGTLRLSLVKCATSPDPGADQGLHEFTYSLLPLTGDGRTELDREAFDLNAPLRVASEGCRSCTDHLILVSCDQPNIILQTLKPANEGFGFVLRLFEMWGECTNATLKYPEGVGRVSLCDLHEIPFKTVSVRNNTLDLEMKPFQIMTLRFERLLAISS